MHIRASQGNLSTQLKSDAAHSESEQLASLDKDFRAGSNVRELLALVAALQRENATLQGQRRIDSMTGLLNRRALLAELEMEWGMWLRSGRFAALIRVNINNFKSFIDSYDRAAGNLALIRAAHQLSEQLRTSDSLAHLNDNEFAVLLRDTDSSKAQQVADKLRANELIIPLDKSIRENPQLIMRYRVGGATLSSGINSVQQWISAAEQDMDRNKYPKFTSYSTRNYQPAISILV